MRDQALNNIKQEKDFGVIINCNLKMSDQCIAASKKANIMLKLISRSFDHKAPKVMKKYVYGICKAIQFWSPNYIN